MDTFQYTKAGHRKRCDGERRTPRCEFVAGGTTLIDLMKLNVERPTALVDINILPLDRIEPRGRRRPENRSHGSQ